MMGAAPVPVPPPMPQVRNSISVPEMASWIRDKGKTSIFCSSDLPRPEPTLPEHCDSEGDSEGDDPEAGPEDGGQPRDANRTEKPDA